MNIKRKPKIKKIKFDYSMVLDSFDKAKNKKIKSIGFMSFDDDLICFVFEDKTVLCLNPEFGYENEPVIEIKKNISDDILYKLKLITKKEFNRRKKINRKEAENKSTKKELETLAYLKDKYNK